MRRFLHDRLYPRALAGLPGLGTPQEFAQGFRERPGTVRERAEQLVRRHVAASSAAGFVGGLGGILLMPVTVPANLTAVALVQLHMAASVAALAGRDPESPAVRNAVLACLVGETPPEEDERAIEQETFDRVGLKLAERGLNALVTAGVGLVGWAGRQAATALVKRSVLRGMLSRRAARATLPPVVSSTSAIWRPSFASRGSSSSQRPVGPSSPGVVRMPSRLLASSTSPLASTITRCSASHSSATLPGQAYSARRA